MARFGRPNGVTREYSFGQQVMKHIASAAEVTEAPAQADLFGTPNCISSDLHPLTERKHTRIGMLGEIMRLT